MAFQPLIKLTGHQSSIYSLVDKDETSFYSLSGDGIIALWSKNALKMDGLSIAKADQPLFCACITPQHDVMVAGGLNGVMHWIDLFQKKMIATDHIHQRAIYDVKISGPNELVSCGGDGKLIWWNIEERKPELIFQLSDFALRCMVVNESRSTIYIGSSDFYVYEIDVKTRTINGRHLLHQGSVFALLFTHDILFSGGRDARLSKVQLPEWETITITDAHRATINAIAKLDDLILTASRDKSIRIWQNDGKLIQTLHAINGGHINSVNNILTFDDGNSFASCSDDRSIILWRNE